MGILKALGVFLVVIGLTFLVISFIGLVASPSQNGPLFRVCPALEPNCGGWWPVWQKAPVVFEIGLGISAAGTILLFVASALGRTLRVRIQDSIDPRTRVD